MERIIKQLLTITEVGMIGYWFFAVLVSLNLINVDPALMYEDYQNPLIVAWNWSFLPIDIIFAVAGLVAAYVPMSIQRQRLLTTVSLSLMFCAGIMAISFWLLQGNFDPTWWAINLWLIGLSTAALIRSYMRLSK